MAGTDEGMQSVHYLIEIAPDLSRLDFSGKAHIRFSAKAPAETIELNILELAVRSCTLVAKEKKTPCAFCVRPDIEILEIQLPEAVSGEFEIEIDYHGEINRSMAGFYKSQYTKDGKTRPMAVTQFQESDARRAFPCMDHPARKATFEVCLVVDEALGAVSNTPVRSETKEGNGRKRVCFEKTPRMSTYLLFFGVGDFSTRQGDNDPRLRVTWLPGMSHQTAYGLEFGEKALSFCETYFDIPYPLPKLDLIAVPDFAFGAMENWGAITFRENLLLYDPEITSAEAEERICEVIAHEIVHQWFGNLVTPKDWRYLWLNESFATYFAFGVVANHHPEWQVWEEFLASQTAPAMARDGLTDTSAIEIKGGSHVVINSSTAPIIYSKGGSILRQIEGYLGEAAFRQGLHDYLNRHAYSSAASEDLWSALEEASGQPVSRIMKAWVETPGHPLLTAKREGEKLYLTQKRFTYLGNAASAVWPIPLLVRIYEDDGSSRLISEMMDTPDMTLDVGEGALACKVNDGETGFFRVAYADSGNFGALCRLAADRTLPPVDRWGLEGDLHAMVKARRLDIDAYLETLSSYREEDHPLVLSDIFSHLFDLCLILEGSARERLAGLASSWLSETADRLGVVPSGGEPHGVLRLRRQVLRLCAFLEVPEVQSIGVELFGKLMDGQRVSPDMRQAVMQVGAWSGGETAFDWLVRQMADAASEQDRINALTALGCFKDEQLIERALAHILDKTPDRNKFMPFALMAQNPYAAPLLWDWYTRHEDNLSGIHPLIHERIIGAVIPSSGLDRVETVRNYFEARFTDTHPAAPAVRMAMEKLSINQGLRDAYGKD
jgi:tricorn protease interacting factor F2/3